MRKTFLTISFVLLAISSIAQINSEKEAVCVMKWLLENPQIETKEIFRKKANAISVWKLNNTINPKLHIKEKLDFIMKLGNSKYSNEFSIIYDFGKFIEEFENENYNEKLFKYYSINGVLKYYSNLIQIDESCKIDYLDKLIVLSDEELNEKFTIEN